MDSLKEKKMLNAIFIAIIAVFAICLIPIIYVSFFSHPVSDDYYYSTKVFHAIQNGSNFFEVIAAACQEVARHYVRWQGSFASIFLFNFQPAVFSQDLYFLTTFIMLFCIIFPTMFLMKTFVTKYLKEDKRIAYILGLLISLFTIEFVPYKEQSLYWYNGSAYYTIFYGFSLFLMALLIRLYISEKKKNRIALTIVSSVFAIFIGGGNYTSALITAMILFLFTVYAFVKKSDKKYDYLIIFGFLMIAFLISAIAPGNDKRAAYSGFSTTPKRAIIKSLLMAQEYIIKWTKLPQIAFFGAVSPVLWRLAKKCKWEFKHPVPVILLVFGIFAAQLTPTLYGLGYPGAPRQLNIFYYFYYIAMMFSLFYVFGHYIKTGKCAKLTERIAPKKGILKRVMAVVLAVMLVAGVWIDGVKTVFSVDTLMAICDGTAQKYDEEYDALIYTLENSEGECHVKKPTTIPDFFRPLGIGSQDVFLTESVQKYYQSGKIIVENE